MASQDQITWLDLRRFGADLALSEKNKYRERLSVLILNDVSKAIALSNQRPDDFYAALKNNGFKIIPSEIPEHRNRMALSYHNPTGSSGLNPRNFQNVFLNMERGDIKNINRTEITHFTAPQQSHAEWRNLFLNNRTVYQKNNKEFYVVACNQENTLKQEYDDFIQNASSMYARSHQVDSMPIDILSEIGYKGNSLVRVYASKDAAYADGHDDSSIRKELLSPFTQAVAVQENGTILAFEDLREVPEIFNHLPSEHPTWADKAVMFADVDFSLTTLNRSAKNTLDQNKVGELGLGKEGVEAELEKLSQDLRDLNRIALSSLSFREPIQTPGGNDQLYYLRKNQEDQQWYCLTRDKDGNFEKELLNPNNLYRLAQERQNFVDSYVYNLSGSHPLSAENNQYRNVDALQFSRDYQALYLSQEQVQESVLEQVKPALDDVEPPLEFNLSTPPNDLVEPELPVIDNDEIDEMESTSLEELIAKTNLRPASEMASPQSTLTSGPTDDQVNEIVEGIFARIEEEVEQLENPAPAVQASLDVDADQPISIESISNSIDNDALAFIQQVGEQERKRTALAREQYIQNMQAALNGTFGTINVDATLDEALEQIAPITGQLQANDSIPNPDLESEVILIPGEPVTFVEEHQEFVQFVKEEAIQPISADVILPVAQDGTQLDTVTESGTDTLVFEDPNTLYSELEMVIQEATYVPRKFIKDTDPKMVQQVQTAQSYRLYAKLYLLPEVQKEITALKELSVTLKNERDAVFEREMINNIGLSKELYPYTLPESRPLTEINDELSKVQNQLSYCMDDQDAINNRIHRIDNAFSRSLETDRLVYSENENEDQQVLDDRVTKAYQTLFSNEAYRQPEKLDLLVDNATRVMMENQYPSRDMTIVKESRLPRYSRKYGRRYQNSRFLKAKQRVKKNEQLKTVSKEIPALSILHSQIADHLNSYNKSEGMVSDIAVMLKGLENITGENQFDFDTPSSNLVRMMRDYANKDLLHGASTSYMNGLKIGNLKDAYGFKYSEQAMKDAKDKLAVWIAAKVEESNPSLKDRILFNDRGVSGETTSHEVNIGNQIPLATFFSTNFIPSHQPTLDGVKSIGWAMGRPGQADQYKLIPYDLNSEMDVEKYLPMKSRNYEVALEESYDHFRLNYVMSNLNIEIEDAPKIEQIAKLIRNGKPESEAEFKALSKELWTAELSFDDFKDENFKLIEPINKEQIADVAHDLTVGNTIISGLSGDELERLARTTVLAKILADAPVDRLDYDILPEHSDATAYAKTLEPSREFKALRDYFRPGPDDLSIKFENPTQYVNDMSERAVLAWNDLVTKLPEIQNDKFDIIMPTMNADMDCPIYRLLPEAISHKGLKRIGDDLGLGRTENWKANDATIYLPDFMEHFTAVKNMPISRNDALLLNVNGYIKSTAKIAENRPYLENPPMYFPRIDNSQLSDEYKTKVGFTPKMFDFIDKNPNALPPLGSLLQARNYNVKKVHADFLANLDYDAIKREATLKNYEPLFAAFNTRESYTDKPTVKNAQSVSALIDAQLKEPFVGVPMLLYKSKSFNANDLSHLRAVPSYVKIPSESNFEKFGQKAVLPNHFIPNPDKPLDIDKFIGSLKSANLTDLPNTPFNSTVASLIKDGMDNQHHPLYDSFTLQADLQEVAIHEDMSKQMIVDRASLKDYYRENLIYQTELMVSAVEKVKADPNHPKHNMSYEELHTANVYLVNYDDNKFPLITIDHKDTNRHAISSKGFVSKIGTVDLGNKANIELQAENITKSSAFSRIVESNNHVERMVINSAEITLSPLKMQDLDPNTTELVKARIASDLQNNIAWHFSNIVNNSQSALGHALVMKPSTETELARFKFVDVRQSDAHKALDDGWKVITSHGFNSNGKKYAEVGTAEILNSLLDINDLLPKDLEATRNLISGKETSGDNDKRGYFGDVGTKLRGAHKDRYGYNFSIDDIRQMSTVEVQSLVNKSKIWNKPDFKEVAARTGDMKLAILAQAVHDMLPGKPKLVSGSETDLMKRVYSLAFYNDMVSGVRNATNEANSLTDYVSKLSQLSRDLNITHGKTLGSHNLDMLYTTKKSYSGHSVSSFLLDASSYVNELYNEVRPPNTTSYPVHPVFSTAIKKATDKLIHPKGGKHEFIHVYAYGCNDFSEDPVKDKQINKEFALYIQTGELTTNLVEKLEYYERNHIKEKNIPIRTYEEVLAELPETQITQEKEISPKEPKPKSSTPENSLDRDGKTIAVVTPVDGRDGVIQQDVKSFNWGMLSSTRVGEDYRQSKNTDAFDLRNTFGMNAVEFGNSTPLYVRQEVTNLAFDAMRDLAKVLNLEESKISLGTGLAFASRGNRGAAAHYDPMNNIINISGQNGAGSLAHEWFHSLDNYLGKLEKNYLLEKKFNLPTATVNATHFLSDMVANGYEPRTPMAKMMADIMESMRYKTSEQLKAIPTEEETSDQKLPFQLSAKKSELQLQWYDKASQLQGTGPTFKVSGVEPKGNDLEEYLKWTLSKAETIANNYNSKVEKVFAKDAKLCKEDSNLAGFKYAADQYSTFIEKSTPQFGITSVTTFVKTQHPLYSEKQRKEVVDGLLKDITTHSIAEQMGGLHCKLMAVQSALYMRDQILKHAPDHLKNEDMVSDFVRSHSVSNLLDLPKPTPAAVSIVVSANSKAIVEKAHTDFYNFAKRQDDRDSKDYWATPWELFARTGEAYVNKKLENLGFKNTFLASGNSTKESPVLPVGPELEEIEKKVDALVEYIGQHILQSNKVYDAENEIEISQEKSLEADKTKEHEKAHKLKSENGLTM
ncbi:hypothetical protein MUB04_16265 [Acinetobacter indicus]|uniref:LPD1 domain-containing protein n=1 Tax=Acinetobacter TaxID=469 RepID=UPI0015D28385|nr:MULTISPECIES: LPD1 domain-containing protein [Acinetobacter]MCP0918095.1 hypothetical protein [Acinetobacter indicus]